MAVEIKIDRSQFDGWHNAVTAAAKGLNGPLAAATSSLYYAAFVERGTRYMAPRAMFARGLAAAQPAIRAALVGALDVSGPRSRYRGALGRFTSGSSVRDATSKLLVAEIQKVTPVRTGRLRASVRPGRGPR